MIRRVLLFTQGFTGKLLYEALEKRGINPVVYTYALNAVRREAEVNGVIYRFDDIPL